MSCALEHSRAVGDILTKFAVQLTRGGVPFNLTGKVVKFIMYAADGTVKIPLDEDNVVIVDIDDAWVDYDFQAAGVNTAGIYKGFFKVFDAATELEPETFPPNEDGIKIILFEENQPIIEEEETIDLIAAANSPKRTRTVEGTVEERSIHELIAADRYNKTQDAGPVPWGMKIARTKPSGPCS